jgi:hypothetical protein
LVFQTRVFKNYKEDLRFYTSKEKSIVGGVYLNYFLCLQALTYKAPGSEIDIQFQGEEVDLCTHSSRAKLNTITNALPLFLSLPKFDKVNSYLYPVHKSESNPLSAKR